MSYVDAETDFRAALESLETELATPLVSGEHVEWTRDVEQAWQRVLPMAREHLARHRQQYDEMMNVDQEIFRHVEQLGGEDEAIGALLDEMDRKIAAIAQRTPSAERDELKTEGARARVVEEGLALVVRIRKQEVGVKTWFQEAFNRDRGPVD